ncbi:MAG: hypothetical protein ACYSU7_01530 [Planctomycetota bacterium]|jgi:hypothetical protein
MRIATVLLCSALATGPVFAQDEPEPPQQPWSLEPGVDWRVEGAAVHQLDTNIEDGGSFAVTRLFIGGGADIVFDKQTSLSVGLGYGYDGYDFSGATGLGVTNPWNDIHSIRLGGMLRWAPDDRWTVFAAPTIRVAAERGADFGDAVFGGGFAGFSYKINDRLSIGPGFGALTQIEDDVTVFPVLLIDWKITDDLTLRTGRGLGATQGPGIVLAWEFAEAWELSFGGRYESQRFRLSDSGPVPNGVGEESSLPIYGGITWEPNANLSLSVLGGVNFAGRLELDDSGGNRVSSDNYDPAGFFGLVFTARF